MKNKTLILLLGLEAVIFAVIALAVTAPEGSGYLFLASFPFAQIGQLLRALSLSGTFGNIAAFILYIGLGALPLLFAAVNLKKGTAKAEDWLLAVISGFAFYMLYIMINPGTLSRIPGFFNADVGRATLGGAFYSLLIGYSVIKLLRKSDSAGTESLIKILRLLFAVAVVILVFAISYIGIGDVKARFSAIQTGNTDPMAQIGFTYIFVLLRYALTQLPAVMEIGIFLLAMRLCGHLNADRYGEEAITSAKKLAAFSKKTVIAIMLSTVVLNLAQIVCATSLVSLDFLTVLPVDSIIVALTAMLLTRFFTASRALAKDNQLFI